MSWTSRILIPYGQTDVTHSLFCISVHKRQLSNQNHLAWINRPGPRWMVASQVFFGPPRGLLPSTSHPFQALLTQSDPSFLTTCPYHLSLFLLMQSVMSSSPVISLSSFVECRSRKLFPQSLLSILLSAVLILLSQSTVIGQVSLPYNMQLRTQEWKTLPFIFKEGALEVRKGESSRNFFHPLRIRADVAASAPPLPSSVSPR